MKIKLTRLYRGWQSNEQIIQPGEYQAGDDALHGADPEYLVENGFAERIDDGDASAPSSDLNELVDVLKAYNASTLHDLTVDDLRNVASEYDINLQGARVKDEIVKHVIEHFKGS